MLIQMFVTFVFFFIIYHFFEKLVILHQFIRNSYIYVSNVLLVQLDVGLG